MRGNPAPLAPDPGNGLATKSAPIGLLLLRSPPWQSSHPRIRPALSSLPPPCSTSAVGEEDLANLRKATAAETVFSTRTQHVRVSAFSASHPARPTPPRSGPISLFRTITHHP